MSDLSYDEDELNDILNDTFSDSSEKEDNTKNQNLQVNNNKERKRSDSLKPQSKSFNLEFLQSPETKKKLELSDYMENSGNEEIDIDRLLEESSDFDLLNSESGKNENKKGDKVVDVMPQNPLDLIDFKLQFKEKLRNEELNKINFSKKDEICIFFYFKEFYKLG